MRVTTTTLSSSTTFLSVSTGYRLWPKSISLPVDLKERKLWELHHIADSLLFAERGQARGKPPSTWTFADTKPSYDLPSGSNGRLRWGRRLFSLGSAEIISGKKNLLYSILDRMKKIPLISSYIVSTESKLYLVGTESNHVLLIEKKN